MTVIPFRIQPAKFFLALFKNKLKNEEESPERSGIEQ